eukprot:3213041-Amphidinium_carterae.1
MNDLRWSSHEMIVVPKIAVQSLPMRSLKSKSVLDGQRLHLCTATSMILSRLEGFYADGFETMIK